MDRERGTHFFQFFPWFKVTENLLRSLLRTTIDGDGDADNYSNSDSDDEDEELMSVVIYPNLCWESLKNSRDRSRQAAGVASTLSPVKKEKENTPFSSKSASLKGSKSESRDYVELLDSDSDSEGEESAAAGSGKGVPKSALAPAAPAPPPIATGNSAEDAIEL